MALFGLVAIMLAALYFFQEKLIFPTYALEKQMEFRLDVPFEEKNLQTRDGAMLNMLHLRAVKSRGVVVFFHGNGGNLERWSEAATYFLQFGLDVMIMDYRGYGKSTGVRSSEAMYDDAQLFYTEALKEYSEGQIVVYGRSLGSTFATYVAARNNPAQLILESPFYDFKALVKEKYPILPVNKLLRFDFPTYTFGVRVAAPTTIIHGDEDTVVPLEEGEELASYFDPDASLIVVEGGGHNDLSSFPIYHLTMSGLLNAEDP